MSFPYLVFDTVIYHSIIKGHFSFKSRELIFINNWIIESGLTVINSYITHAHTNQMKYQLRFKQQIDYFIRTQINATSERTRIMGDPECACIGANIIGFSSICYWLAIDATCDLAIMTDLNLCRYTIIKVLFGLGIYPHPVIKSNKSCMPAHCLPYVVSRFHSYGVGEKLWGFLWWTPIWSDSSFFP